MNQTLIIKTIIDHIYSNHAKMKKIFSINFVQCIHTRPEFYQTGVAQRKVLKPHSSNQTNEDH